MYIFWNFYIQCIKQKSETKKSINGRTYNFTSDVNFLKIYDTYITIMTHSHQSKLIEK